jgi:FKBP-type peptidyl-prolyl cis-trans isomerase 2
MKAKKGDYVKIEYTGMIGDGNIFDTTSADEAKKAGIFDEKSKYAPILLVLGKNNAIVGLEEALEGMEEGTSKESTIPPEKGFGKVDPNLLNIVSLGKFREQRIDPMPGMLVTLDNRTGMIKAVSGGRVVVDFNHPLAGKELKYKVKLLKVLATLKDKVQSIFDDSEIKGIVSVDIDSAVIKPETSMETEFLVRKQAFLRTVSEIPELKKVKFEEEYAFNKESKKEEKPASIEKKPAETKPVESKPAGVNPAGAKPAPKK